MSSKRTILVTGADGFIGARLVAALGRAGENELVEVTLGAGFDLSCPGWTTKLACSRADVIVHLAQSLRYRDFPEGAHDLFTVNVAATAELLEWARTHGTRLFLFASTGNVYKMAPRLLDENAPCEPQSMYAATKFSAELLASQYASFFRVIRMRLFTIYGPAQRSMLIPALIEKIRAGKEITLAGGAGLFFTPLFVDDAVAMIQGLIGRSAGPGDDCYNLSGVETTNIADLTAMLGRLLGMEPRTRVTSEEPKHLQGQGARLRALLNYSPRVFLAEGLERVVRK